MSDQATATCGLEPEMRPVCVIQPPMYSEYSEQSYSWLLQQMSTLQCLQLWRLVCTLTWQVSGVSGGIIMRSAPDNIIMMIAVTSLMPQTPGLSSPGPGCISSSFYPSFSRHVLWLVTHNAAASQMYKCRSLTGHNYLSTKKISKKNRNRCWSIRVVEINIFKNHMSLQQHDRIRRDYESRSCLMTHHPTTAALSIIV